jgi:hypothetical protein
MPEDSNQPCPMRYVYKGRTFCIAAIRERRFTTARVLPATCEECPVPRLLAGHGCANMDIGVEIDEYGPRAEVVLVYTACAATVQELSDVQGCTPEGCKLWSAADEAKWETLRKRAIRRHRALEDQEGKLE